MNQPTTLSLNAMATRFELVLHGDDPARLNSIGEEALREIERLDAQLSIYRPDSDLCLINALSASEPVKTDPRLFRLLQRCTQLSELTDNAFDITIAPLMHAWGFLGESGRMANPEDIRQAMEVTGMQHVRFNDGDFTITFDSKGVMLDLGAIGKGYAIEKAVEILREQGVTSALLHGGTSTIYGLGAQLDGTPWEIAIKHPTDTDKHLDVVELCDSALSVSAVHGKSFKQNGIEYGHVIDPRTGQPTQDALSAAVIGPCPTETDALSTALLVLGKPGLSLLETRFPGYHGITAP